MPLWFNLQFPQYCFPDREELREAVNEYITQDCTNNPGCAAGQAYGWPIGTWCVSQVTDMSWLFSDKTTFNEDLSGWDVSSVTNMWVMFSYSGFNQDISDWDVSSVTDMTRMLYGATSFNQDLCAWGDKFPYDPAGDIFEGSGCTFQDTPQESQQGPFCASECN